MESKTQTLLDKNDVNYLFTKGKSVKAFPLLMYSIKSTEPEVVFSVPKKKINKAVDRNKIKRQMREIYFNDLSGKIIKPNSINQKNRDYHINVSNIENGLYILNVIGTDNKFNRVKVIIKR